MEILVRLDLGQALRPEELVELKELASARGEKIMEVVTRFVREGISKARPAAKKKSNKTRRLSQSETRI